MKEKKIRLIMVLILVVQLLNVLYWGSKKEGYYIDELWTYGLANSYEAPFLWEKAGYMNEWHEPEFYMDYLVANEGEKFAFHSVYENQARDVHPPFYYMILHTVCSLFPKSCPLISYSSQIIPAKYRKFTASPNHLEKLSGNREQTVCSIM